MVHNCSNFEWSLFFLAINPTIEVIDLSKGAGTRFHTTELVWNMCQISWKLYVKSKKDNSQFLAAFHVRATCQDWRSLFSYIGFLKKKNPLLFHCFFVALLEKQLLQCDLKIIWRSSTCLLECSCPENAVKILIVSTVHIHYPDETI